jgi:hypothetical protein
MKENFIDDNRGCADDWAGTMGSLVKYGLLGKQSHHPLKKSKNWKDFITTGCWASPTNPALGDARRYLKRVLTKCI